MAKNQFILKENNINVRKIEEVKIKLFAIEILSLLKKEYSYEKISSFIELPVPVLSRYVNGHVLPNLKRSEGIIDLFKKKYLVDIVSRKIVFNENGIFDHSRLLYDSNLMDKIAKLVLREFGHVKVNKVLTTGTSGVPLASHVGKIFNTNAVISKSKKEIGVESFIEVKKVYNSGAYSYLYIPKNSIKKGERILIIDDVLRTGSTVNAMIDICEKSKAEVSGMFFIISMSKSLKKLSENFVCPIKSLIKI